MSSLALVACDDPAVREEIGLVLEGLRCDVEGVVSARDVLRRLGEDDPPGVVVIDALLHGANQPEFPERLEQIAPATVVVVLIDPDQAPEKLPIGESSATFRFLLRPYHEEELRTALQSALRRANLVEENRRLEALFDIQELVILEDQEQLAETVAESMAKVASIEKKREPLPGNTAGMAAAILDAYDTGLALHARAVSIASRDLGQAEGLPEDTVERIQVAGMLHDIGYLGLPRFHLTRPANRLTDREREEQQKHPEMGESVLAVDENLQDAARLVRHHHENFDGSGYPDGLKGKGIPLGSRIIRLADVFDRAYRRHFSIGAPAARTRGRQAIKEGQGTLLDPELVERFLEGTVLMADTCEIQIEIENLQAGMVLTRDLRARNDLFIAAGGTRLDETHIERIHTFHRKNPILHEVFVRTT